MPHNALVVASAPSLRLSKVKFKMGNAKEKDIYFLFVGYIKSICIFVGVITM